MRGTPKRGRECRLSVDVNHHGHELAVLFLSHGGVAMRAACPPQAAVNLLVVAAYKWPGSGDGNRFRGGAPGPTRRYKVSGFELVAGTLALHAAAPPRRILRACG